MTDHDRIGKTETVVVDGHSITGTVYHVRRDGCACVESPAHHHLASGPAPLPTITYVMSR